MTQTRSSFRPPVQLDDKENATFRSKGQNGEVGHINDQLIDKENPVASSRKMNQVRSARKGLRDVTMAKTFEATALEATPRGGGSVVRFGEKGESLFLIEELSSKRSRTTLMNNVLKKVGCRFSFSCFQNFQNTSAAHIMLALDRLRFAQIFAQIHSLRQQNGG